MLNVLFFSSFANISPAIDFSDTHALSHLLLHESKGLSSYMLIRIFSMLSLPSLGPPSDLRSFSVGARVLLEVAREVKDQRDGDIQL